MARTGGGGLSYVFRLSADHSKIVKADGTTEATALTDAILKIGGDNVNRNIITQTDFTPNEDGSVGCKIGQTKFDSAFLTFQELVIPRKAAASGNVADEELSSETGYKIGGAAGSTVDFPCILISYGSVGDDAKLPVDLHPGYFKKTSGGRTYAAGKFVAPPLDFQSIAAKVEITIANALLDDEVVTAPVSPLTIAAELHEKIAFLDKAA